MKAAISIPDELFEAADRLAESLGVSRSELYANAMREFLARRERSAVTERLDAVYGDARAEAGLTPDVARAQRTQLQDERW